MDTPTLEQDIIESAEEVLEDAPCGFLSTRPDGTIVAANAQIVKWTGKSKNELFRHTRLQDVFPKGEQIYYETHVRPLLLLQGYVREIACHLVRSGRPHLPVFMNCNLKRDDSGNIILVRTSFFDATDRMKFEEELQLRRRQADHLGAIVTSSADAIISVGRDLIVHTWNGGAQELFGYAFDEAKGQPIDTLIIPKSKGPEHKKLFKSVLEGRETVRCETERQHKNGTIIPVELRASTIRDIDGKISGISVIFRDITDRRRAESHAKYVLQELNHRIKNLMVIVQAIATLSGKTGDTASVRKDFNDRLTSLAANQDLLIESNWHGVDFEALLHTQVDHFCSSPREQMEFDGPPVKLVPDATQAIGMVLHELATNSVKYGALSRKSGRIKINWSANSQFEVQWSEHNGPSVTEPSQSGFGTTMLKQMVERATGGRVVIKFRPSGFFWKLSAPSGVIQESANL